MMGGVRRRPTGVDLAGQWALARHGGPKKDQDEELETAAEKQGLKVTRDEVRPGVRRGYWETLRCGKITMRRCSFPDNVSLRLS